MIRLDLDLCNQKTFKTKLIGLLGNDHLTEINLIEIVFIHLIKNFNN